MIHDNGGFATSPDVNASQPVISQTAVKLTNGTLNTNATVTVVAGKRYRFTALITGSFYFGLANVTANSGKNVRWTCGLYNTIEIQIPDGHTNLHYATSASGGIGYLVEIKQKSNTDPAA